MLLLILMLLLSAKNTRKEKRWWKKNESCASAVLLFQSRGHTHWSTHKETNTSVHADEDGKEKKEGVKDDGGKTLRQPIAQLTTRDNQKKK